MVWFTSGATQLISLSFHFHATMESVIVQQADIVHHLGVLLDSELTMKQHVNKVASVCYYHLQRLRQLKCHISPDLMKQLFLAFVLNKLDYRNSLLFGLLWSTITPLQRVHNAAAWFIMRLTRREHVSPALPELHWLHVIYTIRFKVVPLMYLVDIGQWPQYISDVVTSVSDDSTRQRL